MSKARFNPAEGDGKGQTTPRVERPATDAGAQAGGDPARLSNADVARLFEEVGDLLEIKGGEVFRIVSYRRAARTIADLAVDIRDIAARGELEKLPGIGKPTAKKIEEVLRTGRLPIREELAAEVPETLLGLLRIQGMGPKKAAMLWKERGITSLADLKAAIEAGKLAGLKGLGAKSIEQMRAGIAFLDGGAGRAPLGLARPVAELARGLVAAFPGVERVEYAGSLRRGCETVGDLDLLCIAADGETIVRQFTELPIAERVLGAGKTKGSIVCEYRGEQLQIDLRVVPAESFGAAWQYFTGSKEHNVRLRERAGRRGWTLNEYALSELGSGKVIASRTEEEIYAALDLPWIPPELREDRGEFDLSKTPGDLIELSDIRGDLHMHTTASDGRCTLEEMVRMARDLGYKTIAITDHSQASVIANGLKPERLLEHIETIRRLDRATRGITILAGAEVDMLPDGRLDYPDELMAQLDWVVASLHFGASRDIEANTQRTLAAIRNPYVNLIAHPTNRLIGRRDAMPLDVEAIAKEAARTGTALEINASGLRLDLKDQHARLARDVGAMICIDCDAHHTDDMLRMEYGVITARRAWLRQRDVLNARPVKDIRAFVQAKRSAATGAT